MAPDPQSREQIAATLRRHGITPTYQRIEIATVLFARREHLSADRVMAIVNGRKAETSKATVYNTLRLLREKGLIREVIVDPSRVFYDPNPSHHHHFFDIDTGELTDIDAGDIAVTGLPPLPEGVAAEGIDIIVRIRSRRSA